MFAQSAALPFVLQVALLSRNIKIQGDPLGALDMDGNNCQTLGLFTKTCLETPQRGF